MNRFREYFKRVWVWFFRWPSWMEIGLAVVLLFAWLHTVMQPVKNIQETFTVTLIFVVVFCLWILRLMYRLLSRLLVIAYKTVNPYSGCKRIKMAIFYWSFFPSIMALIIIGGRYDNTIQRVGFAVWKYKFEAIVKSDDVSKYSNFWVGWYKIRSVERDPQTGEVLFVSANSFSDTGGFVYSPNGKPYISDESVDSADFKFYPLGGDWHIWLFRRCVSYYDEIKSKRYQ